MDGKQNISQYRDRLDKTLGSHELSDVETLKTLVESQMLASQNEEQENIDNLIQKRTKQVANFLGMLRSASGSADEGSKTKEIPHSGWKIKQDNQDCRVMYREGPAGAPFHTLLVEGYVDGPVDHCLCISAESGLYPKWWPQFNIPTFKVVSSACLQKIRSGEQISLVRMKLSWPLSTREALVHYVTFEYFKDDLIIMLFNTISDLENIDKSTHGFTRDGIPEEENVTRIDIVGGLALQKVTTDRSYFRTIANMDLKLDFVPPAFINFLSRQLIGSGFKLYKKEVASLSKGDPDFSKALMDPFYARIREVLYTDTKAENGVLEQEDVKIESSSQCEELSALEDEVKDQRSVSEIEEIEETSSLHEDNNNNTESYQHSTGKIVKESHFITPMTAIDGQKKVDVSPEVDQALGTLEKVISLFREYGFYPRSMSLSGFANNVFASLEDDKSNDSKRRSSELSERISQESRNSSLRRGSRREDVKSNLTSKEADISSSFGTGQSSFSFAVHEATESAGVEKSNTNGEIENGDESSLTKRKSKKLRFCCLTFNSGGVIA